MQDISAFIFNHLYLSYAFAIVLLLLLIVETLRKRSDTCIVAPLQAVQLINHSNGIVLDLRSRDLFSKGHIIGAQSITSSELTTDRKKLDKFKGKPVILVCASGTESQKLATLLRKEGYNVYSLSGGIRAWTEAEMPLVKE